MVNRPTALISFGKALVLLASSGAFVFLGGGCAKQVTSGGGVTYPVTLSFAGNTWLVKESSGSAAGPGPNVFSSSADNVFVDTQGQLHLKIINKDGIWTCAEVVSQKSFGYGTYVFYLGSATDSLDPSVVLGMFTWSDAAAYNHRELDVELSRWGSAGAAKNSQFVVQPSGSSGHLQRFVGATGASDTNTYLFDWSASGVAFQAFSGNSTTPAGGATTYQSWTFSGSGIPVPGGENTRINLWLNGGTAPAAPAEVVIAGFQFIAGS